MAQLLNILLLTLAALLWLPIMVVLLECLAAVFLSGPTPSSSSSPTPGQATGGEGATRRPRIAVLIPAHNEQTVLATAIASLRPQLADTDRIVVVADNCADATAQVAVQQGAVTLIRDEPAKRGKGYALDFGLRYLEQAPPDQVIMVDADCVVGPQTIGCLSAQVQATGRPAQAIYLMQVPPQARLGDRVSSFAFMVKNRIRPLGLWALGFPCLLTGTGMAFPWEVIRRASLANGSIVEDMRLGIELALAGDEPQLCTQAIVLGILPSHRRAAALQRKRWEHGHLGMLVTWTPRLLRRGIRARRANLIVLGLEMLVPPLSLLTLLILAGGLGSTAAKAWAGASWLPAAAMGLAGGILTLTVLGAWAGFARGLIPARSLAAVPWYLLRKVPLYVAAIFRREKKWVRTERTGVPPNVPA